MARTQQQRREETVARLLDASIATIIEVGYARASAAVIAKRAGVSGGRAVPALRHHGRLHGGDGLRRCCAASWSCSPSRSPRYRPTDPALEAVLTILRDITGELHQRGDLRADGRRTHRRKAPRHLAGELLDQYGAKILDTARVLPGAEEVPGRCFRSSWRF